MTELVLPGSSPKIAARTWGNPGGRRVLALHGWLDNAATFDALAPLLSPDLHVVAVDLPGHGLSEHRSADASYHIVDGAIDVLRIADALGWDRFTILGHSLGATLSTLAAAAAPARVAALALIEGLVPLTAPANEAAQRLGHHIASRARARTAPVYPTIEAALAARAGAGEFVVPQSILPVVRRGLVEVPGGFAWRSDPRLKLPSALRLTPELAEEFLKAVACPILLVKATRGLLADAAGFAAVAAKARDLRVVELPGFHHLHLDTPEPVAAAVNAFLAAPR